MNPDDRMALVKVEGAEGRIEAAIAAHLPADERYQAGPLAYYVAAALGLDREDWPTLRELQPTVKPLRWHEFHGKYRQWRTGNFHVKFEAIIDTSEPLMYGKFPLKIDGYNVRTTFDTLEEAQAFAQDEFECRVRSALESTTQPAFRNEKALG